MGYKKTALQGVGIMGTLHLLIKGFAVIKIAILANLLTPYDIGLYGVTILVLSLFETFSEIGLSAFLIQLRQNLEQYIGSVFIVQIIRGVILSLLIAVFAYPISFFFNDSFLIYTILIVSTVPLIKSFENPYIILFQKELFFKKEFFVRLTANLFDLLIVIVAALIYRSIFGVILGLVISSIVYVLLSWLVIKNRPSFANISKNHILKIINFAKSVSILGAATFTVTRVDAFLIGRFAGLSILGGYQFTQRISFEVMNDASAIVGKVTFPVYSKIAEDKERLRRAFLRSFTYVLVIEGFIAIVLLIFSKQIILIVAGPEWLQYQSFLRLFAVYGFLISTWGTIGSLLFSLGKQSKLVFLTLLRLIILAPLLFVAYRMQNPDFVIISLIISLVLIFPPTYMIVKKYIY